MSDKTKTPPIPPTLKHPARIVPTVGRVVLFHAGATPPAGFSLPAEEGEPCDAHICHVNEDDTVNLAVFDAVGAHHAITNVPLFQGQGPIAAAPIGGYCTWMPYQQGQAAKAEELQRQIDKQLAAAAKTDTTDEESDAAGGTQ